MSIMTMTPLLTTTATGPITTAPSSGWDSIGGIPTTSGIHSILMGSIIIITAIIRAIITAGVIPPITLTDTAKLW